MTRRGRAFLVVGFALLAIVAACFGVWVMTPRQSVIWEDISHVKKDMTSAEVEAILTVPPNRVQLHDTGYRTEMWFHLNSDVRFAYRVTFDPVGKVASSSMTANRMNSESILARFRRWLGL